MKSQQPKRNRWMYLNVILLLLALVSFSILPLVKTVAQEYNRSNAPVTNLSEAQKALQTQALGYQMVLEREPNNQNALEGLLEIKIQQGDLQGAIAPLEKLAQLNPLQTDYTILLAQAKQQLKDYEGAIAAYRSLLTNSPRNLQALKGISDLYLLENRPSEAVSLIKNALAEALPQGIADASKDKNAKTTSVTDSITSLQILLGEVYIQQERSSEALAAYEQAIESNNKDFRPVLAKALLLQKQNKNAEAEPFFDKAVELAPVDYKDQIKKMALKVEENLPKNETSKE
jgi:tetratricopeptide (TPR) repeat protein